MTISKPNKQTIHGPKGASVFSMRVRGALLCLLFTAAVLVPTSPAWADDYADRTPGQRHLDDGLRAYNHGRYNFAKRQFLTAARWSDKLAQYNLGVMHYHGHGFEQDSAQAWAWFKVAAERDYPLFVDVADQVWDELDESQRRRALAILEDDLLVNYGDAVTVPRTVDRMRSRQRQATGSRVGWASAFLEVFEVGGASFNPYTQQLKMFDARRYTGQEYYARDMWDFERIMKLESFLFDAESRGQVKLGDFHVIEEGEGSSID